MNKENLIKIMEEFANLLVNAKEITTVYEDENGYCHGVVDYIDYDDIRDIYYKIEKELGI